MAVTVISPSNGAASMRVEVRAPSTPGDVFSQASIYDSDFLRQQVRWIRDDLDPQIAREGANALRADDLLKLDELLRRLMNANLSLDDIRISRMHLAVLEITGRATRWPKRLIDRGDALKEAWEAKHGSLKELGILLYEPGGRLHNVCRPEDLSKEKIIIKWIKSPHIKVSPVKALRFGDLGFKPGHWWINPLFAFRDSIIDTSRSEGGVVADSSAAYAVLLAADEEIAASSPESFVFRSRPDDKGRYRLTSGTPESRHPVRILRSHTLRSLYAPKAGVRYDGLHKVAGWCIKMDSKTRGMVYDITFKRLPNQVSMESVLARPYIDEIEDYKEYKRLREMARQAQAGIKVTVSGDGAVDDEEMDLEDMGLQTSSSESERADIEVATPRRNAMAGCSDPLVVITRKLSLLDAVDTPISEG